MHRNKSWILQNTTIVQNAWPRAALLTPSDYNKVRIGINADFELPQPRRQKKMALIQVT